MNQKKMYSEIVRICRANPKAANDRAMLLERIFYNHGWLDDRGLYDNLCRMPRTESIYRRLREAINNGDVVIDEEERKRLDDAGRNELNHFSNYEINELKRRMGE